MNRNKLRLVVEEGHDFKKIKIVDENYTSHGESIHFKDGYFWYKAFCKEGYFIGKIVDYNKYGEIEEINFYSFITPGIRISELEHKKELAKLRLGLIECPQLSLFLKDFGYEHGY